MEYMRTHISEKLQLSELADIAGYSLSFFKVKFKKEVGITPPEYINLQKFEAAKKLLTETNQSITDIAYSLGFSSSGGGVSRGGSGAAVSSCTLFSP